MAGKKPRRRRSFTPEFKAEVVALVRQPGKPPEASPEMGLTETAVRAWVRQAELDDADLQRKPIPGPAGLAPVEFARQWRTNPQPQLP